MLVRSCWLGLASTNMKFVNARILYYAGGFDNDGLVNCID